ncbi:MAG: aldehyde dehydrogenase family protein [Oligoflexia bacterium]|nr:aldehyde dehydrogenase family protein [Oligoflexia bacterium]
MTQKIISRNPATGEILRELDPTPQDSLPGVFTKAKAVQAPWTALSLKKRATYLLQLREALVNQADEIAALISRENGKPEFEALSAEILPCLDMLTHFAERAPQLLRDQPIPLRTAKHRKSYLNYWPVGVVAVISPWNFPFMLPFAEILMAVVAGNAVIFKPSEATPLVGLKIQELFGLAGFPQDLLQTIVGDGTLGAALVRQKPDKIFFTGSVATGKRIAAAAAENLVPVNLELGGKDPMIVLPDADLDYATSAALWGGFMNSGQACASVERLLVHESIAKPFIDKLKEKMTQLRVSGSGEAFDLGPATLESQKEIYARHISEARQKGATFELGGDFSADQRHLKPTLVTGPGIEELSIYNEETFGPVIALTTFKTVSEAVAKANRSIYGLHASIMSRDTQLAETMAKQLEFGTVLINEVAYTAGLGETPWGGVKHSGIGRSHADIGLYEFVHVRHIQKPRASFLVFKSWWWFPYSPYQKTLFRIWLELYRKSGIARLRALSHFLWNLVQFLKNEKRI